MASRCSRSSPSTPTWTWQCLKSAVRSTRVHGHELGVKGQLARDDRAEFAQDEFLTRAGRFFILGDRV